MAVKRFKELKEWQAAVLQRGLVVTQNLTALSVNLDDELAYEPSWAVQPGELGLIYDDSLVFGMFQNVPIPNPVTKQTTVMSDGFLCDTVEEFMNEMLEVEAAHDMFNSRDVDTNKPTLH